MNNEIGLIWRTVRVDNGVSLGDLSRKLNLSKGYLSELELGKKPWLNHIDEMYRKEFGDITRW